MSLENRFNIRPEVLVLKNSMVARLMELNMVSCRLREALMHMLKKADDLAKVTKIVNTVMAL